MGKEPATIRGNAPLWIKYPSLTAYNETVPLVPSKIFQPSGEARRADMVEKVCPKCGCRFIGMGYVDKDILYCCEPCAKGGDCECGCCTFKDPDDEKSK